MVSPRDERNDGVERMSTSSDEGMFSTPTGVENNTSSSWRTQNSRRAAPSLDVSTSEGDVIRGSSVRIRGPALTEEFSEYFTADFTYLASEHSSPSSSSARVFHRMRDRDGSSGSHSKTDLTVSFFQSCIPQTFGSGASPPPPNASLCSADVFRRILLFVDAKSRSDIIEIGSVCRFWRYYSNYAPHWTAFRKQDWSTRTLNLPKSVRTAVSKPKMVTREEYVEEKKLLQKYCREEEMVSYARYVRWCAALGFVVATLLALNFAISFFMGYFPSSALSTDTNLGVGTFFVMIFLSLMEVAVVVIPLGGSGEPFSRNGTGRMSRVLSWSELLVGCSVVFGVVTALAFSRVQSLRGILGGPLYNMTMNATCEYTSDEVSFPSFVSLPAALDDIRWRPLTADPTAKKYIPLCLQDTLCFSLLFFDSSYSSAAFHNLTGYSNRLIGSYTALGHNVFTSCSTDKADSVAVASGCAPWCRDATYPQIISLPEEVYKKVSEDVEMRYPTAESWLYEAKPSSFNSVVYRTGNAALLSSLEYSPESVELWRTNSLWYQHFIPLLTTVNEAPQHYEELKDHYFNYAIGGMIITSCLWLLMVVAQCILRSASMGLLGITTCATVFFLNPISMLIAGAVCVNVTDYYAMCTPAAGGCLVGGGVSIAFVVLTIYFSL